MEISRPAKYRPALHARKLLIFVRHKKIWSNASEAPTPTSSKKSSNASKPHAPCLPPTKVTSPRAEPLKNPTKSRTSSLKASNSSMKKWRWKNRFPTCRLMFPQTPTSTS